MHLQYDHEIIFDSLPVGQEAKQFFILPCTVKTEVTISQLFCTTGIEQPFTVKKRFTRGLDDKIKQELAVGYAPRTPDQKCVCYYKVEIENAKQSIFRVTGCCESLSVQMSVQRLDFYRFNNEKCCRGIFELQNNSNGCVTFQFDVDNEQKVYVVEPYAGKVLPKRHSCITVKFVTRKTGIYLMELPCLFMFHAPIFVRLFGVNSTTASLADLDKLKSLCSILTTSGYDKYMTEYYGCPHVESACHFTRTNFDFTKKKMSLETEIMNLTDQCMKIIWDTENSKAFTVKPQKKLLCPNDRDMIQCYFTPPFSDQLFAAQIYGKALIYPPFSVNPVVKDETNCVLVPFSVRLMGSSFNANNAWTPNIDIFPQIINMPMCNPKGSVFSTFIIKRIGVYPVSFKFIWPDDTHFQVKPLIGIIKGEYQLFVVKFEHETNEYSFQETWNIQFNQREDSMFSIQFKAAVEEAKVTVGTDNKINFGKIFPGCKKRINVPIYNNTQNTLRIKFSDSKWFHVEYSDGLINAYDTILSTWCYTASCDVPPSYNLKYELFIIHQNTLIVGTETVDYVNIVAGCEYTKLCSSPIYFDFKDIICGRKYETSFTIFNFGNCEVFFSLRAYEHIGSSKDEPITITPVKGFLAPQDNIKIDVNLFTNISCLSTYCIHYHVRVEEESDEIVEQKQMGWQTHALLFRICFYSYYPTLKFVDIGKNSTGPLFGKMNIWEFFEIDQLNKILASIQANETEKIDIRVPEAQLGITQGKSIVFIIKNISPVDTTCRFTRKKICSCKLKQIDGSFTFRKYTYESCPHRKLLDLECLDEIIQSEHIFYLTISVTYNMSEEQKVCYLMRLSHNRTIKLYFHIASLKPGELSTFKSGFNFIMQNVYIGELDPRLQLFWLANNTHEISNYNLDTSLLDDLNKRMGYDILTCLNPHSYVNPKQRHNIKFLFKPISIGVVNIDLPMVFGCHNRILSIRGEATSYYTSPVNRINSHYHQNYYKYPSLLVHISTENIVVKTLPTHCKVTRIFTLRNVTKTSSIGFWVEGDYLENIIHMSVNPSKGVLHPKGLVTLVLTVHSYGTPCTLRATCPVHFIDQTALNEHIQTKTANFQEATETSDFFTITEHNITYAKPTTVITPPPKIFHRNIAVTCSIIDLPDIDMKIPLQEQLKHYPFKKMGIYSRAILDTFLTHTQRESNNRGSKKMETPSDETENENKNETFKNKNKNENEYESEMKKRDRIDLNLAELDISSDSDKEMTECKSEEKCCLPLNDREFIVVHTVLESLIRNVIYSERFKYQVRYDIKNESDLYYEEFNSGELKRDEEGFMTKLYLNQIPASLVSDTMQVLIGDALLQKFRLGVYPTIINKGNKMEEQSNQKLTGKDAYAEQFTFLLNQ